MSVKKPFHSALRLVLALVLAGLAPGLEFYSVLAADFAIRPGAGSVQAGPLGPAFRAPGETPGPDALRAGAGLGVAADLRGRALSFSLPLRSLPAAAQEAGSALASPLSAPAAAADPLADTVAD